MDQPRDLTGHVQSVFDKDTPPHSLPPTNPQHLSRPFASDGFTWFIYSLVLLTALTEFALIIWTNLL